MHNNHITERRLQPGARCTAGDFFFCCGSIFAGLALILCRPLFSLGSQAGAVADYSRALSTCVRRPEDLSTVWRDGPCEVLVGNDLPVTQKRLSSIACLIDLIGY